MARVHLWDGTSISPVDVNTNFTQGSQGIWFSLGFVPRVDTVAYGLRYYWTVLDSDHQPDRLGLWTGLNPSGNFELLASFTPPPIPSSTGWADYTFTSQIPLLKGRVYNVAGHWSQISSPRHANVQQNGQMPQNPPDPAILLWHPNVLFNVPNTSFGDNYVADNSGLVDITYEGTPPPQPATSQDVRDALASWLSSNGSNFPGSPLATTLGTVTSSQYGNSALLSFLQGVYGASSISTWSLKEINEALQLISTAIDIVQKLLGGPGGKQPGAVIDSNDKTAIDYLIEIASMAQNSRDYLETLRGLVDYPGGLGWSLVDETDFTDDLAWPVAADLYVVSISNVPASVPDVDVAGVHWLPRLGWWAELNNQHAGERHFLDRQLSLLHDGRRRLEGLWLHCRTGTTGHVQAWQRTTG
jgi:hypothetical protein